MYIRHCCRNRGRFQIKTGAGWAWTYGHNQPTNMVDAVAVAATVRALEQYNIFELIFWLKFQI